MNITLEISQKYIATLLEDKVKPYLPGTAASSLQVEVEKDIELLAEKVVAHWKEMRRPILKDSYTCRFYAPATAWQHFKQDHMPDWFKRHYPVRNKSYKRTVRFTRFATYPMADIALPTSQFGQVVIEDTVEEISS